MGASILTGPHHEGFYPVLHMGPYLESILCFVSSVGL